MKYLSFIACFALGSGAHFLLPGANIRRTPETAPRKVLIITQVNKPQMIMPTEYVTVSPYIRKADLKRVPQVSEKERRADFDSKTIAR